jgi:protoheme IX farnesyltransferase
MGENRFQESGGIRSGNHFPGISKYQDFLSLIKIGILHSNLITAFAGMSLALFYNGVKPFDYLMRMAGGLAGIWLVIAGSCVLNNYIDRDIDGFMDRTKNRPTVTGGYPLRVVLFLGWSFLMIGHLILFSLSLLSGIIALFGSFVYVVVYSLWTKRKSSFNTIIGSFSGAVPPLIGWAVIDPDLHRVAWVLFAIMFLWQPPHFLALAMKKGEEYRKARVPMLPVVHGTRMAKRQILVWIFCLLPLPFLMGELGFLFLLFALLLNGWWLFSGLLRWKEPDGKWASRMFVFSLNYLTFFFTAAILFSYFHPGL